MIIPARSASCAVSGANGPFRRSLTVYGPGVSTAVTGASSLARAERGSVRCRSSEVLTAAAFSGVPSLKRMPRRIWIVTVRLSAEIAGSAEASCGTISSFEFRS